MSIIIGEDGPHWLEMVSWGSQVILVVAALIALRYGYKQVEAAVQARMQDQETAHAGAILEMDARWESPELLQSREVFMQLREEVLREVGVNHPKMHDSAKRELVREAWAVKLGGLRGGNDQKYMEVMRICSFFETVGLLVKKGYVRRDDVIDLFKGPILAIDTSFGGHIDDQLKEMGMPDGLYEHALFLCQDCENPTAI